MPKSLQMIAGVFAGLAMLSSTAAPAQSKDEKTLQLEAKILLGDVRGRIDHMAVDLKRQRLFVSELGNDSVGVVRWHRGQRSRSRTGATAHRRSRSG